MSILPYSKLRADTLSTIPINAGVLVTEFDLASRTYDTEDIVGATTGNLTFNAKPGYSDFGEDINNCPKNTKGLKRLENWDIKMTGTLVTCDTEAGRMLTAQADIDAQNENHIVPRGNVDVSKDFCDLWFLVDYGDVNTGETPGLIAIHMKDAMSTGGFQLQTGDQSKGQLSFEFTAHYDLSNPDSVPFDIYILPGVAESNAGVAESNTGGSESNAGGSESNP